MTRLLVAYATRHGSTQGVAERIGARLPECGAGVDGGLMKRVPRNFADLSRRLAPRGYRVFAGVIDRRQWPFLSRLFFWSLGGRLGDNRDWDEIDDWARGIGDELRVITDVRSG